jgi:hypothetical protein
MQEPRALAQPVAGYTIGFLRLLTGDHKEEMVQFFSDQILACSPPVTTTPTTD